MRRRRRPPNERHLKRWLDTGTPVWVEDWIDDPTVTARLERLSTLSSDDAATLRELVEPHPGFHERTALGVQRRVDDLGRLGAVLGLLSLGPQTARALLDPDPD